MPLISLLNFGFCLWGWRCGGTGRGGGQDARETFGPGQPKRMKAKPPNSASPLTPGGWGQHKAPRGSPLTFALSPWTWSGWLSGDLGSSSGQGWPVLSQTLWDAAPE